MTDALQASGLVVRYGGVAALSGVDLAVAAGELLGLVGANGAGKTTLLDCLSGHTRPAAGTVWLDGADISRLGPGRRARRGVIRSFADARLFPSMVAAEVLKLASGEARRRDRGPHAARMSSGPTPPLVAAMGLEPYLDQRVATLSTGVRKRLDLACMAALRPRVLLLDEPSAGLAAAEVAGLTGWLRQVRDATDAAVVMVEHDLPLVWALADRVVILAGGRVAADGPPATLRAHPALSFGRFPSGTAAT
jgi:ABC-type branched-subunit amino acid transport system ATPase component